MITLKNIKWCFSILISITFVINSYSQKNYHIEDLDISNMTSGWKVPSLNKSIKGTLLKIGQVKSRNGIGVNSTSKLMIKVDGFAKRIHGIVGVDDCSNQVGSVVFYILGDRKVLWSSGIMHKGDSAMSFNVDLSGIKVIGMLVTDAQDGISYDYADWINVVIESDKLPVPLKYDNNEIVPIPKNSKVSINIPKVIGIVLGKLYHQYIPISGTKPIKVKLEFMPKGSFFDSTKQEIVFMDVPNGIYRIKITAENSFSKDTLSCLIKIGSKNSLTPPLGWNSWNCYGAKINDSLIFSTVKVMHELRLNDYGWSYIIIDDGWQGPRDTQNLTITPNINFNNIENLSSYIVDHGFKLGIYSTPWITSFAGYCGSSSDSTNGYWSNSIHGNRKYIKHGKYTFEKFDVMQFDKWKVDFVKYDWNPIDTAALFRMKKALNESRRNVVFSISNSGDIVDIESYKKSCNLWRTTSDIKGEWYLGNRDGKNGQGFLDLMNYHKNFYDYQEPGFWNDPDMLVIGNVGWGNNTHSSLSPFQQMSHFTLWCIWSAPLILGNDFKTIDQTTINLITNTDVIQINQDPLGKQAKEVFNKDGIVIFEKELADSSIAIAVFNTVNEYDDVSNYFYWPSGITKSVFIKFSDFGFTNCLIRDLWEQKDLGLFKNYIELKVPEYGVKFIKCIPK